jgi:hypothetical protein
VKSIDVEKLSSFLLSMRRSYPKWADREIIVCSMSPPEMELFDRIFPSTDHNVTSMSKGVWDLSNECPIDSDIVIACNVLMYTGDPERCILNARKRTRLFVMLDQCIAHRGGQEGELAMFGDKDHDVKRFSMSHVGWNAVYPDAYDLSKMKDDIVSLDSFTIETHHPEPYRLARTIIAAFRGDRA